MTTDFTYRKLSIMQKLFIIGLTLASQLSFAITCPNRSKAPLCPDSGSTLLDETYPTQAFVISKNPIRDTRQSDKVTGHFISAIAKSYNYENMPQVLIPMMGKTNFQIILNEIEDNLKRKKVSPEKIEKVLGQITQVGTDRWTWQQDYFESFVDLNTGAPALRHFESYSRQPVSTTSLLAESGKTCAISQGDNFPSQYKNPDPKRRSFGSGEMGGNVEGAPGGLCLTGINQSMDLAKSYCGKEENVVQLQTSWLRVGHVDEIFKIIPSEFNDGRPKECQFSIMAASPKVALDLMKKGANAGKPFFEFDRNVSDYDYELILRSRSDTNIDDGVLGNKIICDMIERAVKENKIPPRVNRQFFNKARSVFLKIFLNEAYADIEAKNQNSFKCYEFIDSMPTEVLYDFFAQQEELINLNTAIQDSIDADKKKIKDNILKRLPQCAKYYDEVDVPNLFYGMQAMMIDGKPTLPKDDLTGGSVDSFFPNPTNSVLMNRSILLSDSGSGIFDNYVSNELKKRKLDTIKIDTWDYAHIGYGNIHCSSHSIPFCKPRGQQ